MEDGKTGVPPKPSATPIAVIELVEKLGLDALMGSAMRGTRSLTLPNARRTARFEAEQLHSIRNGDRNSSLISLGGRLRRTGMERDEIEAALQQANLSRCEEPLPVEEVARIAASLCRYAPAANVGEPLTDVGNANRFARTWGDDTRYVPAWDKWLIWTGTRWQEDTTGEVQERAKRVALDLGLEADLTQDGDIQKAIRSWSKKSQAAARLEAMIKLAKSVPSLVVEHFNLDANRDILGVRNGTVDLLTGQLRDARREDLITRIAPVEYVPDADCPRFLRFLGEIFEDSHELMNYVQRVVGYALSGHTGEQCLFFFYGSGANGKTTLLNVIQALLGDDLARQTPCETIMARFNGRPATNDLARLHSARVVITNEVEDGLHFGESQLKLMTGQDKIASRFLYREFFEYTPQFKLFIAGNHKPVIKNNDEGIWRRIHLVPFVVTIPDARRDAHLLGTLRTELPGILNWALEGHREWRQNRLSPPAAITDAVSEYREDMDLIGQWITECCEVRASGTMKASDAYMNYRCWCSFNGHHPLSNTAFGRKLKERFRRERKAEGCVYYGLALPDMQGTSRLRGASAV